jgi:SSS family transporter
VTGLDWSIVGIYIALVLAIGFSVSSRVEKLKDYYLAGSQLGITAVAISIIATETSAATVIGGPDTSFRGDITYLQTTIGAILSRFVLAYFFIEAFYENRVYTVYGYLRKRFGQPVQFLSAGLFSIGRLFASGARLYIASYALSTITGIGLYQSIVAVGVVAMLYGVFGGLRAVVITDIVQGILFLAVGVACVIFVAGEAGGFRPISDALINGGKLRLFDFRFDLFSAEFWANPYTFLGAVIGGFTLGLATHGTDQDMVQRMLACRDSKSGKRSLILAAFIEIPVACLYVGLGLVLWYYFQQEGVVGPTNNESVFPYFVKTVVPDGLRGLVVAAILAAAMSSLDSAITALSSVSVADFWHRKSIESADELSSSENAEVLKSSRIFSLIWGLLLIIAAMFLAHHHQSLIQSAVAGDSTRKSELLSLALGVMTTIYGTLLGIFLLGLFSCRGSSLSLIVGGLISISLTLLLRFGDLVELGWTWHIVVGTIAMLLVGALGKKKPETWQVSGSV